MVWQMEHSRSRSLATRPIVLIVDEHEEMLALYAMGLFAMGFDVVPARDRAEAYHRASETHPDIIVTQLMISNADGVELVRQLQQDARTRDIPVVGWRGYPGASSAGSAEQDGSDAAFGEAGLLQELAAGLREILARDRSSRNPGL